METDQIELIKHTYNIIDALIALWFEKIQESEKQRFTEEDRIGIVLSMHIIHKEAVEKIIKNKITDPKTLMEYIQGQMKESGIPFRMDIELIAENSGTLEA